MNLSSDSFFSIPLYAFCILPCLAIIRLLFALYVEITLSALRIAYKCQPSDRQLSAIVPVSIQSGLVYTATILGAALTSAPPLLNGGWKRFLFDNYNLLHV